MQENNSPDSSPIPLPRVYSLDESITRKKLQSPEYNPPILFAYPVLLHIYHGSMPPLLPHQNLLKPYHSLQLTTAFPKIQLVQLYEYLYVLNSYLNQIQQLPFLFADAMETAQVRAQLQIFSE